MTDLTIRMTEVADRIGDLLDVLNDPSASRDDKAAAWAVGQQIQKRIRSALGIGGRGMTVQQQLIEDMTREGLKELGPLSIKSTAVDPKYECNEEGNWGDDGIQSAMADMKADPELGRYVRSIPAHLEIDVLALTEDIRLGADAAIALYRELNRRGWRTEQARRLSLAVREVRAPRKEAA